MKKRNCSCFLPKERFLGRFLFLKGMSKYLTKHIDYKQIKPEAFKVIRCFFCIGRVVKKVLVSKECACACVMNAESKYCSLLLDSLSVPDLILSKNRRTILKLVTKCIQTLKLAGSKFCDLDKISTLVANKSWWHLQNQYMIIFYIKPQSHLKANIH